jgi:hypothetical protein
MALACTTKLEAVSSMLLDIGERPISTLASTERLDVVRAITTLDETSRIVQARGWWFNEEEFTITPSVPDGYLTVPSGFIKVDLVDRAAKNRYAVRGTKLYDKIDRTDQNFTESVNVVGVYLLDYEQLPETARRYIYARAAITFQSRSIGSTILQEFTEAQAQEAWVELKREETEYSDTQGVYADRFHKTMYDR